MSPRERTQLNIMGFLTPHLRTFNAPYGILPGLNPVKTGGKVRVITFGVARTLDATITIWSPDKIVVEGQGALAWKVDGNYNSAEELINHLKEAFKL